MGQQGSRQLFRPDTLSSDPTAFRVFVKKRNKFIPGWLKINDDEIIFARSHQNYQCWPLAYLRRYGYTCSGVFFFESGRRCATGEGLHTFQSHQAERIFQVVQSKIKIEEYAREQTGQQQHGSRASSVASNRIHPVQSQYGQPAWHSPFRFCSEGAGYNSFAQQLYNHTPGEQHHTRTNEIYQAPAGLPTGMTMSHHGGFGPEHASSTAARQRLPSAGSAHSMTVQDIAASGRFAHFGGLHERPRSVVSAVEHGVYATHPPPHPYHHGLPPPHYLPPSASSSSMVGSVHSAFQPPVSRNALGGGPNTSCYLPLSASGSGLMNRSFMSTMTASTTASTPTPQLPALSGGNGNSPWTSQQHLIEQSDIVKQHTIAASGRRYAPNRKQPIPPPAAPPAAVLHHQFQPIRTTSAFSQFQQPSRFNDHHYVNVDLLKSGGGAGGGIPPRELHRTMRTGAVNSLFGGNNVTTAVQSQHPQLASAGRTQLTMDSPGGSKIPLPSTIVAPSASTFSGGQAPLVNYALLDLEKTSAAGSVSSTSASKIPHLSLVKPGVGSTSLLQSDRSPGGSNGRGVGVRGQTTATMGSMMVKKD